MANKKKKCRGKACGTLNGDFSDWCSEHYILTFLLASSVISMAYVGISNLTSKK